MLGDLLVVSNRVNRGRLSVVFGARLAADAGSVFRVRAGVAGLPVPPTRIALPR